MKLFGIFIVVQRFLHKEMTPPNKESRGEMIDVTGIVPIGDKSEALRYFHRCTEAPPERETLFKKKGRGDMIDVTGIVSFGVTSEALRHFHRCAKGYPGSKKLLPNKRKPRIDDRSEGDRFFRSQH